MSPARKEPDASTYAGRFAIRLRTLREKAGLTPEEVAEQLGVSLKTVYNWESGYTFPKPDQLPTIAQTIGVKTVKTLFPDI
jgi:Predicted transcriptional regulators